MTRRWLPDVSDQRSLEFIPRTRWEPTSASVNKIRVKNEKNDTCNCRRYNIGILMYEARRFPKLGSQWPRVYARVYNMVMRG